MSLRYKLLAASSIGLIGITGVGVVSAQGTGQSMTPVSTSQTTIADTKEVADSGKPDTDNVQEGPQDGPSEVDKNGVETPDTGTEVNQ